jgi:hypothetical protein
MALCAIIIQGFPNGQWIKGSTTVNFRGQSILRESIKKLGALGMAKAKQVLLSGFVYSGTAVVYHADAIAAMVKAVAPQASFRALTVDAVHPKFTTMFCTTDVMKNNCKSTPAVPPDCDNPAHQGPKCANIPDPNLYIGTWMDGAYEDLHNQTAAVGATFPGGCTGVKCLLFNESAKNVKTDMYNVQGMPGVWDLHCNYEASGPGIGPFPDLVACSAHGNFFFTTYQCAQYPNHCLKTIVSGWLKPLMQKYLDDLSSVGKPGFAHSCFLGAYWNSPAYPNSVLRALLPPVGTNNQTVAWWRQIRVDGILMRDAVTAWWNGTDTTTLHRDCLWGVPKVNSTVPPSANPNWPGKGSPPANPDGRVPWFTSQYSCNPTCWGNPFY